MKQISYAEATEIVHKRARARGIKDIAWQVRDLRFEQRAGGIQAEFHHYQTGKYRRTYIEGCYLPDRPDPSLSPAEYAAAKAAMNLGTQNAN